MKLRGQLLTVSLLLIVFPVAVADILLRESITRQLTAELRENLYSRLIILSRAADPVEAGRAVGMRVDVTETSAIDRATAPPELATALADGRAAVERDGFLAGAVRVADDTSDRTYSSRLPLASIEASVAAARWLLIGASLVFMVAAVSLVIGATGRVSRVVGQLTDAARRMAGGDLGARTRVSGADELGALGRTLDHLASSLAHTMGELAAERDRARDILAAMKEGLLVLDDDDRIRVVNPALREMLLLGDVVGKKPLEALRHAGLKELIERGGSDEIEVSGVKPRRLLVRVSRLGEEGGKLVVFFDVTDLRRLESLRRDFVANVSHELRTPVTAVRSAAETLRGVLAKDPVTSQRFLEIIERNAERLQDLVEDVLDLSRIESRQYNLRPEPLEPAAVVGSAIGALRERAEKKRITLRSELPAGLPEIRADRRAVDQVLANLVDNAIKYCTAGSKVTVGAVARGGEVVLSVEDDGPGIETRHLPRLFERFYRVDPGRGRDSGGTGLGLSIVKHLVEAMGGRVTVDSAVGRGSTFLVSLPAAAKAA